ncbi:hypothetical protein WH47_03110 [Habropoda laboriosa]|uniref:Uncharacterized protein n=1 Tax=Habropoda laboriosa TaxID=597456 RepID=A0A0L7QWK5_9HYME|nr:hypothetical protein WH47_03110 [Habropoda laboriosa]
MVFQEEILYTPGNNVRRSDVKQYFSNVTHRRLTVKKFLRWGDAKQSTNYSINLIAVNLTSETLRNQAPAVIAFLIY